MVTRKNMLGQQVGVTTKDGPQAKLTEHQWHAHFHRCQACGERFECGDRLCIQGQYPFCKRCL